VRGYRDPSTAVLLRCAKQNLAQDDMGVLASAFCVFPIELSHQAI
jgi:hypothetical protein